MTRSLYIDTLRTIAVLLVVFFHFNISLFSKGHYGVEIFIFITGLLMGATMHANIVTYFRSRYFRIVPQLSAVVIVSSILAFFHVTPYPYNSSVSPIIALPIGLNFVFSNIVGYFGEEAKTVFTLHLWSISVEIVFYMLAAIAIYTRYQYSFILLFSVLIFTLEFAILSDQYYAISSRAIFFFLGLFLVRQEPKYLMFGLLYEAWWVVTGPSVFSIDRILLLAALLLSYRAKTLTTTWTPEKLKKVIQHIASLSYEIFLVHWPLLVILCSLTGNTFLSTNEVLILLVFTYLAARALSYYKLSILQYHLHLLSLLIFLSVMSSVTAGFSFRLEKKYEQYSTQLFHILQTPKTDLSALPENELSMAEFFIGDSHARMYFHIYPRSTAKRFYLDVPLDELFKTLEMEKISGQKIYVSYRWSGEKLEEVEAFVSKDRKLGLTDRLTVFTELPTTDENLMECYLKSKWFLKQECVQLRESDGTVDKKLFTSLNSPQAKLINSSGFDKVWVESLLCGPDRCKVIIEGDLLYRDRTHLSEVKGALLFEGFRENG